MFLQEEGTVRIDDKVSSVLPLGLGGWTSETGHILILPTQVLSRLPTGATPP